MIILSKVNRKKFKDQKYCNLKAAMVSGIINVLLITPLSVITNTIVSAEKKKGISLGFFEAISLINNQNGVMGFYKGLGVSMLLVSNPVINFTVNEIMKKFFKKFLKNDDLKFFVSGAISKFLATIFTYPITTIKTNQ